QAAVARAPDARGPRLLHVGGAARDHAVVRQPALVGRVLAARGTAVGAGEPRRAGGRVARADRGGAEPASPRPGGAPDGPAGRLLGVAGEHGGALRRRAERPAPGREAAADGGGGNRGGAAPG